MVTPNHNDKIRSQLLTVFAEATLVESSELDTQAELATIGVDSILAQQLAKMIGQQFEINFSPVLLFEQLSIDGIYEYLISVIPESASSINNITHSTLDNRHQSTVAEKGVSDKTLNDAAIIIVGIACRLAQIENKDDFWETLIAGEPTLSSTQRWGNGNSQYIGGFIENIDQFDADFFRISPAEAICMDPQQRVLLEVVQHSIDDSLLSLADLKALNCAVITTSLPGDYKFELAKDPTLAFSSFSFAGNAFSTLSGRISYFYDVNGPSVSLDTACSSGLLGVHYATQCLRNGDCDLAIVAGATVFATPEIFRFSANANMSSRKGHCAAFSSAADGFVPAEGAVSLLITNAKTVKQKQLPCYAEIVAIGTNHDGKSNGLMAPNAQSQRKLIEDLYTKHTIQPTQLAYIETHGTGTALGDPIEIKGLTDAFNSLGLSDETPIYLGAVKQLIGHTLVSSGLASVVKLALCFQHQRIPAYYPQPNVSELLELQHFRFLSNSCAWPADQPLAAISAFGFTGSNAHLVLRNLRSFTADQNTSDVAQQQIPFCLSASNLSALTNVIRQVLTKLAGSTSWEDIAKLAYNLLRKPRYAQALVVTASTIEELQSQLQQAIASIHEQQLIPTHLVPQSNASNSLQEAAGLWWKSQEDRLSRLDLPAFAANTSRIGGYPFERQSFWVEPELSTEPAMIKKPVAVEAPTTAVELKPSGDEHQNIATALINHIAELLGFSPEQLSAQTNIEQLGLDSLSAITLLAPYKHGKKPLQAHDLFKFSTIHELSLAIQNSLAGSNDTVHEPVPAATATIPQHADCIPLQWLSVGGSNKQLTPLLLMPPLNTGKVAWTQQLQMFKHLSAENLDRPIYIPCYPGHRINPEASEAAQMPSSFSLQGLCAGVAQFIEDELQSRPVDYVGWSLGGCLGLMLAQQQPQLIKGLVLVSCSARYDQSVFESTLDLHAELASFSDQLSLVLDHPEDIVQTLSAGASMADLKHYYDDLMKFDVSDRLHEINRPTLIIHGEKDVVISEQAIKLLTQIPHATLSRLSSHGHFSPLTAGRQFNRLLQDFFAGLS